MCEKVFAEFFGLVDEGFIFFFDKLTANGTEGVDHAEIDWVWLLVEAFGEDHIDLVLAHVDGEGFEVVLVGMGVVGLEFFTGVGSSFDELGEAGSEHELLIKRELLVGNSFHYITSFW